MRVIDALRVSACCSWPCVAERSCHACWSLPVSEPHSVSNSSIFFSDEAVTASSSAATASLSSSAASRSSMTCVISFCCSCSFCISSPSSFSDCSAASQRDSICASCFSNVPTRTSSSASSSITRALLASSSATVSSRCFVACAKLLSATSARSVARSRLTFMFSTSCLRSDFSVSKSAWTANTAIFPLCSFAFSFFSSASSSFSLSSIVSDSVRTFP